MPRNSHRTVHGTLDGYTNHGCRCQPCKTAWAAYTRGRRRERGCDAPGCENVWTSSTGGRYYCHRHLLIARGEPGNA